MPVGGAGTPGCRTPPPTPGPPRAIAPCPVESTAPTFSDPPSKTDGCQTHPPSARDTCRRGHGPAGPPRRTAPRSRGPDIRRNASKTQPRQVRDLRLRHSLSFPRATFTGGCHRWALCPPTPPSDPSRGNKGMPVSCHGMPPCRLSLCLSRRHRRAEPSRHEVRGGLDGTTTDTHPCAAEPCFPPALQARTPLRIVAICTSLPCTALSPSSSTYCAPRGGPPGPRP